MGHVEQKRDIVVASLQPGVRPADVARLHGINAALLHRWRRKTLEGQLGEVPRRCLASRAWRSSWMRPRRDAQALGEAVRMVNRRRRATLATNIVRHWRRPDRDHLAGRDLCACWQPGGRQGIIDCDGSAGGPMIGPPSGVRIYLACDVTDMRTGAIGLAMLVQQGGRGLPPSHN